MLIDVRHVGIVVNNIENSLKFYRDIFGLQIQRSLSESGTYIDNMLGFENVKVKTIKMSAPNGPTLIELLEFDVPKGRDLSNQINDLGASHVAFTVSNIDEMCIKNGKPEFLSNNNGGILGGISTGQDIIVRFCVKPTSSILTPRKTLRRS